MRRGDNVTRHQAVLLAKLTRRSRFRVGVPNSNKLHRAGMALDDRLRDPHAEASVHQMFLGGHDRSRFGRGARDGARIERFDRMHVEHPRGDPLVSKLLPGPDRFGQQQAGGDDREVRSRDHFHGLADLEALAGLINHGNLGTSHPDVDGAAVRGGGPDQRARGHFIGRRDHREAGKGTGQGNVLDRPSAMGRPRRWKCRRGCPPA